jgi:hypothetical protein
MQDLKFGLSPDEREPFEKMWEINGENVSKEHGWSNRRFYVIKKYLIICVLQQMLLWSQIHTRARLSGHAAHKKCDEYIYSRLAGFKKKDQLREKLQIEEWY